MRTLDKRVSTLEARSKPGGTYIYQVGLEPEPVDARPDDRIIGFGFYDDEPPVLDLDQPLSADTETYLSSRAKRITDGRSARENTCSYHTWDSVTREFVSPYGLRRPALPRP